MMSKKKGLLLADTQRQMINTPHRDLSHEEVMTCGGYESLVKSGVYKYHPTGRKQAKKKEVKNGNNS